MTTFYTELQSDSAILKILQPGITTWHRLEADPTALDMAPGLDARLADPLWLIGRQWQLGELRGEDAGTPIHAHFSGTTAALAVAGSAPPTEDPADALWEPRVEAEANAIRAYGTLPAEAGLDFERCLAVEGAEALVPSARHAFPLGGLDDAIPADRRQRYLLELMRGSAIDGAALLDVFLGQMDAAGSVSAYPPTITVPAELTEKALRAATSFVAEWRDMFVPASQPSAWIDRRLEYAFDIASDDGSTISVDEYSDGRVDWWSMTAGNTPGVPTDASHKIEGDRLPLPIRYAGMPADRYFEFEDGTVNFAGVDGGAASVASMLTLEYMLAASNDWYHLPLSLEYGHSFTLDELTVTDTFGRTTTVQRAPEGDSGWSIFTISRASDPSATTPAFVLPAVVAQTLEGEPIEEVAFFRDETANLVWATERRTPGLGNAATSRRADATVVHQAITSEGLTDAAYVYRMQSPVPLNWHPMIAVANPDAELGTVLFRRVALRRTVLDVEGQPTVDDGRPHGALLQGTNDVLEIEENEVPRSGIIVTRSFQMARTTNGGRLLWLGRAKRVGRGEGSSGLYFDVLDPAE
ncbi:hypothetical protein [Cryobacterium arcticum]|uniref:Uncharacterized protein n=1 Tax=Cryobacterium arcticum TaxID=670052 RepID=A0A317ZS31_9MICO|nr:hypothetical protein [Cryobacterium arcticum]PXA67077.1 hypothetical protein CTB96_09895 [Cryobacterium arcticum]